MRRLRHEILLALGLVCCLLAVPALAALGDGASAGPELRLPVSPPPAPAQGDAVRQIRVDVSRPPVPAPPDFSKSVETLTQVAPLKPPVFDETLLLGQVGQPPRPPDFSNVLAPGALGSGTSSVGPALRLPASTPGQASANALAGVPVVTAEGLAPDQWKLTADRIVGQHDSEYLQAVGNASLVKGTDSLKADFIRYYQSSRWVTLKGNVRIIWEGDLIEAEEGEFDLNNRVGWLKRGKVFVGKSHLYFQSDTIRKYDASSYRFQNAKITGCDGDRPAWSFNTEEGDINIDGRTKLWHSTFNILDKPSAYAPFLSLPGGAKRESGFLVPEISHSSRRGMGVNQPYYWAMDDERDLTFYENAMSSRGLMQGLEYRHTDNPRTKGDWRLDYLNDRKTAKNFGQEEAYLQNDNLLRPNSNRWWLRSKLNSFVGDPAWTFKLDLDAVSDQNYLREFGGGTSGFDISRKNFLSEFGRDIDLADSLTRTSTAYLSRSWDSYGLTAKMAWSENLAYRNGNNPAGQNPTTQTLPEVNFYAFKDQVPGTPLEWEGASRFNYFWREYGTRGIRTDLHPTLSLPLNWGPMTFIPTTGLRNTAYTVGGYTNEPSTTTTNKTPARTVFELGFTGFTEASRVYSLREQMLEALTENVGKSEWWAMRHSVAPRLEFAYVPAPQSQGRLPYFDSLDRVQRQNTVTYSLTNVLDRKRASVVAAPSGNATIPTLSTDYLDFFRLRVEQSFDRDEAARSDQLATYRRRPFSDVLLEATVQPEKYLALTSKSFYSPYLSEFTEHEHLLTLKKEKLGEVRFGHDYLHPVDEYKRHRTNNVQTLLLGADAEITDKLKLTTNYRMDIAGHSDLEKSAGLTWTDQCYNIQLLYKRKPSDQSVELRFNLLDFGKP